MKPRGCSGVSRKTGGDSEGPGSFWGFMGLQGGALGAWAPRGRRPEAEAGRLGALWSGGHSGGDD